MAFIYVLYLLYTIIENLSGITAGSPMIGTPIILVWIQVFLSCSFAISEESLSLSLSDCVAKVNANAHQ